MFTFMQLQLIVNIQNATDHQRVTAMFHHLRVKRGFYARMALAHCANCAQAHIAEVVRAGLPYCYFHKQDATVFGKDGYLTKPLFLSWGIGHGDHNANQGETWLRCAEQVVTAGILAGMRVTWEGTAAKRIALHPTRPGFEPLTSFSRN